MALSEIVKILFLLTNRHLKAFSNFLFHHFCSVRIVLVEAV